MNNVQLEFSAVRITSHPITADLVNDLLLEAQDIYKREREFLDTGKDIDEFGIDSSTLLKPLPKEVSETADRNNSSDPRLHSVVMKTKGVSSVQKAVQNYRERQSEDNQSKACVIL